MMLPVRFGTYFALQQGTPYRKSPVTTEVKNALQAAILQDRFAPIALFCEQAPPATHPGVESVEIVTHGQPECDQSIRRYAQESDLAWWQGPSEDFKTSLANRLDYRRQAQASFSTIAV